MLRERRQTHTRARGTTNIHVLDRLIRITPPIDLGLGDSELFELDTTLSVPLEVLGESEVPREDDGESVLELKTCVLVLEDPPVFECEGRVYAAGGGGNCELNARGESTGTTTEVVVLCAPCPEVLSVCGGACNRFICSLHNARLTTSVEVFSPIGC